MSFRLKKDEPLASGIRRLAREQLEQALGEIRALSHEDEGAAVLATRKRIKRTRALLRLVRRELGRGIFNENRRLSGVARTFSGSRDAQVQLQVLETLRRDADQERDAFPETTRVLIALKRTYRRGRDCLRTVLADPSTENFYSWRKRVKDLYYQAQILRDLHRGLRETAADAKSLSRQLGEWHDLAFYRERLEGSLEFPDAERALLLGLIGTREQELERAALECGTRFYADKPGVFDRRLLTDALRAS